MAKSSEISVFIDGASRGNPGPASIGAVFIDAKGGVTKTLATKIGVQTNNIAEYYAFILAMQEALMMKVGKLKVFTDSELLAKQFNGEYKVKEESIKLLFLQVAHLKKGFEKLEVTHVPREKNKLADEAANKALDNEFFL